MKITGWSAAAHLFVFVFLIGCAASPGHCETSASTTAGWHFLENNQLSQAHSAFAESLASNPHDIDAIHGLTQIDMIEDNVPDAVSHLFSFVSLAPNDPRAVLDWERGLDEANNGGLLAHCAPAWEAISENSSVPAPIHWSAKLALAENYRIHADMKDATAIWSDMGFVKNWGILGPFDNVSKSGFKKPFLPETHGIDYSATGMVGKNDIDLKWTNLTLAEMDGTCPVAAQLGSNNFGVYYSATAVQSEKDGPALLWFEPNGASKIWVNGKPVLSDEYFRVADWKGSSFFSVPVTLDRGWNTILVKSTDDDRLNAAFRLRFTDPSATHTLSLSVSPDKVHTSQPVTAGSTPVSVPAMESIVRQASPSRQNLETLAYAQDVDADFEDAVDSDQKALTLAPNDGWLMWEYSRFLTDASRPDEARTQRDKARAASPNIVEAQIDFVNDSQINTPNNDKITLIHGLLSRFPFSAQLLYCMSLLTSSQSLQSQSDAYTKRTFAAAPGAPMAEAITATYQDDNDNLTAEGMIFLSQALTKLPGDTTLLYDEAQAYDARGDYQKSLALQKLCGDYGDDHLVVLRGMASTYEAVHRSKDAILTYLKELTICPQSERTYSLLGDSYSDIGQKQQAIAAYQTAVQLDPSVVDLRDKIRLLQGAKPVLDLVPAVDAQSMIAAAKGHNGKGDVRFIVDQAREVVYPDGATDERIHDVILIQDHAAVESFSQYRLYDPSSTADINVISANLIKADGKTVAATDSDSSHEVDFPSLDVGDTIDVDYDVTDYNNGGLAHKFWAEWFFDHPDEDIDFSQFSLITPKGTDFAIAGHGAIPKQTITNEGDWIVHQWKLTNYPARTRETSVPASRDRDDWIDISNVGSWHDIVAWYADLASSACEPDDTIRAEAQSLTQGAKTDNEKIKAIVSYVRQIQYQSTPFRLSAFVPTDGKDVIRDQYADCKDKAALIASLLNSLGIDAEIILLSPRESGITPLLPSPRFDHAIVRVKTEAGWQWIDATADQLQYGYLPIPDQGVPALPIDPQTTDLELSPVGDAAKEAQVITTTEDVQDDGSIKGTLTMKMEGTCAWVVRTGLSRIGPDQMSKAMQGLLGATIQGAVQDSYDIQGTDNPDSPIEISIQYHADNYVTHAGDLLLVKVPFSSDDSGHIHDLAGSGQRTTPIEMDMMEYGTQGVTLDVKFPTGYTLESTPSPAHFEGPWGTWDFVANSTNDGHAVLTQTTLLKTMRIPTEQIPDYLAALTKENSAEPSQIVLKKSN